MSSIDLNTYKKKKKSAVSTDKKGLIGLLNYDIQLGGKKISSKKAEAFYNGLLLLLEAGVDLSTSLDLLGEQQKNDQDADLYRQLNQGIMGGESLSECILASERFSKYEYYSLKIGEESGSLNSVLQELGAYYERKIKQQRTIVGAMSYPVLVITVAFGAVFFMLRFLVPMFEDIFKRSGSELPWVTRLVIKMSDTVMSTAGYFFLSLILIASFLWWQRKKLWFRNYSAKLLLGLPLFGKIFNKIYMIRFSQSMALLLGAKVPLVRALELVKDMIGFYPLEIALEKILQDVVRGKNISVAMKDFDLFDRKMIALVKVAEETNKLDYIFSKMNKQLNDELEHQSKVITTTLEPIIIIVLGCVVTFILIAMYLPMFKLTGSGGF